MKKIILPAIIIASMIIWTNYTSAHNHNHENMTMYSTNSYELSKSQKIEKAISIKMEINKNDLNLVNETLNKYNNLTKDLNERQQKSLKDRFIYLLDYNINKHKDHNHVSSILKLVKLELETYSYKWVELWDVKLKSSMNIAENAMTTGIHNTLVTAVVEAWLAETLMNAWPFTVFAPIDSAFESLPEWTLENLLNEEWKTTLTSILTYHVLSWIYTAWDLKDWLMLETLQGDKVTFTYNNWEWFIDNAKIILTDVVSSNWVIHAIDSVIMPE